MIITKYGIYNLRNNDIIKNVIQHYKSYDVRPFAFFSDAFIFQWFWNNMYLLLILMILMHVCNIYLLYKICDKINVKLNAFSMILFAFCPILIQALYWISASTRIVYSVFLCLSSIYLMLLHFDENNKAKKICLLIISVLLNLICVGFYEQTIAFNLFLMAFILIVLKKYKYFVIPILSTSWIGAWYIHFTMTGEIQARGALNIGGIIDNTLKIINDTCNIFINEFNNFVCSFDSAKNSFLNSSLSILMLVLIMFFIYYIFKNKCLINTKGSIWKKICMGLIITISPLLPFLILKDSFIAVRNLYISMFGLAILVEIIIDMILGLIKNEIVCNTIKTSFLLIALTLFIMYNIDGVNNYRKVHELDNKVIGQIINSLNEDVFKNRKTISINYDTKKLQENKNISNYIESVIESDWATSGKIQVMRKSILIGKIFINPEVKKADYNFYFDDDMNLAKIIEGKGIGYE